MALYSTGRTAAPLRSAPAGHSQQLSAGLSVCHPLSDIGQGLVSSEAPRSSADDHRNVSFSSTDAHDLLCSERLGSFSESRVLGADSQWDGDVGMASPVDVIDVWGEAAVLAYQERSLALVQSLSQQCDEAACGITQLISPTQFYSPDEDGRLFWVWRGCERAWLSFIIVF
jgi:hypothetical protein